MIAPLDPRTLTPAQKAQIILSEAQDEMRRNLWRAALGDGDGYGSTERGDGAFSSLTARADASNDGLAQLLAVLNESPAAALSCTAAEAPTHPPSDRPNDDIAAPVASVAPSAASGPVAGLGANARYTAALNAAASRTGMPPSALAAIIDAEAARNPDGGWNPYSRNSRSSAAGLGQFLTGTWLGLAKQSGSWLHRTAHARGWLDEDGHVKASARSDLLALRYDPTAAIESIADYSRANIDRMRRSGVAVGPDPQSIASAAYLGHHLRPGDALRFVREGLSSTRARNLLVAQIGESGAIRRIQTSGDATSAHRSWLTSYILDKVDTSRYTAAVSAKNAG